MSVSAEENKSLEEVEDELKYLEEEYAVNLTISESNSMSIQSNNVSEQDFEDFQEEMEAQAQLLTAMSDEDNWEVKESSVNITNEFSIMNLSGTTEQVSAFDITSLGPDWSSSQDVPLVDRHITFFYEAESSSVSGGLPTFTNISDVSSAIVGVEPNLDWIEGSSGGSITSAGSQVDLSTTGTWETSAEWNGISGELSQSDTWNMEYSSSRL